MNGRERLRLFEVFCAGYPRVFGNCWPTNGQIYLVKQNQKPDGKVYDFPTILTVEATREARRPA